jgi:hypothetical protein
MILLDGHQSRPNEINLTQATYAMEDNYKRQKKEWLEVFAQWSEKEGLTEP